MTRRQRRARLIAAGIGVVTTGLIALGYLRGWLDWLEWKTLDQRFLHANSLGVAKLPSGEPRLLCVDIDDSSLDFLRRKWPWPRDWQAPLISILGELGATHILVDLTWVEPEPVRSDVPEDADITQQLDKLEEELAPERIQPDRALSSAIRAAENVYLALEFKPTALTHSEEFDAAVDALLAGDEGRARAALRSRRERLGEAGRPDAERWLSQDLLCARLTALLQREPRLKDDEIAARLGVDLAALRFVMEDCADAAMRRTCASWLRADAARWELEPREIFEQISATVSGETGAGPAAIRTRLARRISKALRETLSYHTTAPKALRPAGGPARNTPRAEVIVPVYFEHARHARRCGFVVFDPEEDGIVRRMPVFVRHHDDLFGQLALTVACDALEVPADGILLGEHQLTLRGRARSVSVQLDANGSAVIPWTPHRQGGAFAHLPAHALLALHQLRMDVAHNRTFIRLALTAMFDRPFLSEHAEQRDALRDFQTVVEELRGARDAGRIAELQGYLPELERLQSEAEQLVRRRSAEAAAAPDAPSADDLVAVRDGLADIDRARAAEPALLAQIEQAVAELRPRIDGRICLIGYTASSLPDMKPIPTSKSQPGVLAHANALNGLLLGRTVRWLAPGWNAAITILLGLLMTAITIYRAPREAVSILLLLLAALVGIAATLFAFFMYWIAVIAPAAALLATFSAITVFTYIYVERERRQLSTALSQYTSKEIARQVAEDVDLCRRAEMREVTAIFTDLRGFTGISERIGAENTQRVLNVCLGRSSEVMLRHEAMINKFIGDGIFAFWNPVIYPQADHARRACETAIDLLDALAALSAERSAAGDLVFRELSLRIGIATGNAVVGPCGSEQKYDYTCIGDSVNVASRLESANKFFGTRILVADRTRSLAGPGFVYRELGGVQVKGRRAPVGVLELLGREGVVDGGTLAYAGEFARGVRLFQERKFRESAEIFGDCLLARPDDRAVQVYLDALRGLMADEPGEQWSGAIELTEK